MAGGHGTPKVFWICSGCGMRGAERASVHPKGKRPCSAGYWKMVDAEDVLAFVVRHLAARNEAFRAVVEAVDVVIGGLKASVADEAEEAG